MVKKVFSFPLLLPLDLQCLHAKLHNIKRKKIKQTIYVGRTPHTFITFYNITIKCKLLHYIFADISDFVLVFCKEDKCDRLIVVLVKEHASRGL